MTCHINVEKVMRDPKHLGRLHKGIVPQHIISIMTWLVEQTT